MLNTRSKGKSVQKVENNKKKEETHSGNNKRNKVDLDDTQPTEQRDKQPKPSTTQEELDNFGDLSLEIDINNNMEIGEETLNESDYEGGSKPLVCLNSTPNEDIELSKQMIEELERSIDNTKYDSADFVNRRLSLWREETEHHYDEDEANLTIMSPPLGMIAIAQSANKRIQVDSSEKSRTPDNLAIKLPTDIKVFTSISPKANKRKSDSNMKMGSKLDIACILTDDYPTTAIDEETKKEILKQLDGIVLARNAKIDEPELKLQFLNIVSRAGVIVITCNGPRTANFLKLTIDNLKGLAKYAKFKCIPLRDVEFCPSFVVFFPEEKCEFEKIKSLVKASTGIQTEGWIHLMTAKKNTGSGTRAFFLGDLSLADQTAKDRYGEIRKQYGILNKISIRRLPNEFENGGTDNDALETREQLEKRAREDEAAKLADTVAASFDQLDADTLNNW